MHHEANQGAFNSQNSMKTLSDMFRFTDGLKLIILFTVTLGMGGAEAAPFVFAVNESVPTICLEEDNVSVPISGTVGEFSVMATHPRYAVGLDNPDPDFTGCGIMGGEDFTFEPTSIKAFDNGVTAFWVIRKESFWRPQGMTVKVDGVIVAQDAHRIEIAEKIVDANSWPISLAWYSDGYLRLKPHPQSGQTTNHFGSSVIVGPVSKDGRPLAEIETLDFSTASKSMTVTYRAGGSAVLRIREISRTLARVDVEVDFSTSNNPFCTVRSNFVEQGRSDLDHIAWGSPFVEGNETPINDFEGAEGTSWLFSRKIRSDRRHSSPDIRVFIPDTTPPVISYRSPGNLRKITSRTVHRGVASDDRHVSSVSYRMHTGPWRPVTLQGALWSFRANSFPARKRNLRSVKIQVMAEDSSGNRALTSRRFSYQGNSR